MHAQDRIDVGRDVEDQRRERERGRELQAAVGASRTVEPQRGHSARSPRAGSSTRRVRPQGGSTALPVASSFGLWAAVSDHERPALVPAALRQRPFRGLFTGASLAMMADSIEHVISYWILFEKFQSPALGGFAVVSHWLPFLLFSVYSGALAERWDPRRMIQIGMGLFMAVSIGWGVLFATDALADVARDGAAHRARHGGRVLVARPAAHDPRGGRGERGLQRRAPDGDCAGSGCCSVRRSGWDLLSGHLGHLPERAHLRRWCCGCAARRTSTSRRRRADAFADIVATAREISGNPLLIALILLAGGTSLLVGNAYHAQMPEFAHHLGHYEADFTYGMLLGADAAGALVAGLALESRGFLARARGAPSPSPCSGAQSSSASP